MKWNPGRRKREKG